MTLRFSSGFAIICFFALGPKAIACHSTRSMPSEFTSKVRDLVQNSMSKLPDVNATLEGTEPPSTGSDTKEPTVLPTASEIAEEVAKVASAKLINGEPMQYSQIINDCQNRAEVAAALILDDHPGWVVGKAFIGPRLSTANGLVKWGFHVAPYVLGENNHIFIVDPAFDRTAGIEFSTWVSHALQGKEEKATHSAQQVTIQLRGADRWGPPGEEAASKNFCADVKNAVDQLVSFRSKHPNSVVEHEQKGLSIDKLKESAVWFKTAAEKKRLDGISSDKTNCQY